MKTLLGATLASFCFLGPAVADPAGDALYAKAVACIRSAAPEVIKKAEGLTDAMNFIINGVCVVDVQHAEAYAESERTLAEWSAKESSTQMSGVTVDPNTGELKAPPGFLSDIGRVVFLNELNRTTPRVGLFAEAARAVLAARGAPR